MRVVTASLPPCLRCAAFFYASFLNDRLAKFTAGFLPHQRQCTIQLSKDRYVDIKKEARSMNEISSVFAEKVTYNVAWLLSRYFFVGHF